MSEHEETSHPETVSPRPSSLDPRNFVLDLDRILEHLRVLGIDARLQMNDGGTPVLLAGTPRVDEKDGHKQCPAVAGPPPGTMPTTINEDLPCVVGVGSFLVGPDEHDPSRLIDCWEVGIYDEALVAYLIAAQVAAPRGTLVDEDAVARIARGEIRPGWRRREDAPTNLGGGSWVTRYVHVDGLIVDDNTRNIPEELRRDIAHEGHSGPVDEANFVGHAEGGGWDQFPSITVAMLFAEGHV